MSNLERELRSLASSVDWPDTPDVVPAVTRRLVVPRRRPWPQRRVALAVAVLLATLLAALAVPPARTAILDWLGIGGVRIVRVDELPALAAEPGLEILGDPVSIEEAAARAGFPFARPPRDERPPAEIRVAPGSRVSYVWRDGNRVRLLITQFPGSAGDPGLLKKLLGESTRVETFELDFDRAVWLEGGPHVVYFLAPDGTVRDDRGWLAGNTLLVDHDGVTLRLEGALDRDDAVDLVRAMRPD
jgi:hypothetical protein